MKKANVLTAVKFNCHTSAVIYPLYHVACKNKQKKRFKMKSAEQITVLRSISNTHSTHNEKRNAEDATANNKH